MKKTLRLFVAMMAMFVALVAKAEDYTLKVGDNTLTGFVSANAVYTAKQDGKVLVEAQEVFEVKHGGKVINYQYVSGSGFLYKYEIDGVKKDDQITVHSDFVWNSGSKIRVTEFGSGPIPVDVVNVTPSEKKTFSWLTTGMITVNFNKAVTLSGIQLIAGDYTADAEDVHVDTSLGFNITTALNDALNSGYLKPGEKFYVKISGLCDRADKTNKYNGDGILMLEFIAPYPQHDLVKTTVGDAELTYMSFNTYEFLSYYPTDGTDGVFVLEFDDNVSKVSSVYMTMGNLDLSQVGKYYRGSLPYKIDGNKIIIDARGTLRTLALLFPAISSSDDEEEGTSDDMFGGFDTSHLTITVSNVLDSNGNSFRSNAPGSIGSYSFVLNYKEIIDEAYLDGDNKAEGENVNGLETISLWLSNADIKFKGIEVRYFVSLGENEDGTLDLEQKIVEVDEWNVEVDPIEGVVITFKLPEMPNAAPDTKVRVALKDASSADGMPHYLYIEYKATGVVDCIKTLNMKNSSDDIYRLDGVKVKEMKSGMYIRSGKVIKK